MTRPSLDWRRPDAPGEICGWVPWWYWVARPLPPWRPERPGFAAALALALTAITGCASAQPAPPALPSMLPAASLDVLLPPPAAAAPIPPPTRDPLPVDEGQCPDLPGGILLDENTFARAIATKSERDRLATEARVLRELRARELAAVREGEKAYHARVQHLEQELARARADWRPWAWVALGVAITAVGAFAGAQATR